MSPRLRFALVVLLQVLVLFALIGSRAYTLATGTRVLLETEPIDPRDPFRGDYVRLNYVISDLDLNELQVPDQDLGRQQTAWVLLAPGSPYWEPVTVSVDRPAAAPGQVAVRARVASYYDWEGERRLHLIYGTESFFVPEGEGRKLEGPEVRLDVEVAVDRFGRPALARVLHEGREIRFE